MHQGLALQEEMTMHLEWYYMHAMLHECAK